MEILCGANIDCVLMLERNEQVHGDTLCEINNGIKRFLVGNCDLFGFVMELLVLAVSLMLVVGMAWCRLDVIVVHVPCVFCFFGYCNQQVGN
jgi:hypothetical protein